MPSIATATFSSKGFFDTEEAPLLQTAVNKDPAIKGHFYDRGDAEGMTTKMATWNHPGDSVYGYAARSSKMADTMEDLLGGEVYHYHSKITAKEPREGGAWEWHQATATGTTMAVCSPTWPRQWPP